MQEQEEQLSDGLLPVVVAVVVCWLLPACKSSAPVSVGVEVAPLLVVVVLLPPRTVFVVRVVVVVFVFVVVVVVLLVPLPSGIVRGAIPS